MGGRGPEDTMSNFSRRTLIAASAVEYTGTADAGVSVRFASWKSVQERGLQRRFHNGRTRGKAAAECPEARSEQRRSSGSQAPKT
jgi:hypothetical protein